MKIDNELKNFWNDEKKVKKVEEQLSKEERRKEALNFINEHSNRKEKKEIKFNNESYFSKDEKEPILNINNLESKKSNILGLFILVLLIIGSIFMTYFIYSIISERNEQNKQNENFTKELERMNNNVFSQDRIENKEETIIYKKNHLKLDNDIYSNNLYAVKNRIYNTYKDIEFVKNLEPFFNNLTTIILPANDKIYEFEIKGIISRYGNFSYIIYKRTNIIEYDNQVIRELERIKKIKFREQQKDVDFSLTITNRYKLIN